MSVSREAVTWGYRFFLGREPESEDAILAHCCAQDERQLAENLLRSPEFMANRALPLAPRLPDALDAAPIEVETDATAAEIASCLAKVKAAWKHLGSARPHFSVLTDPKYLPRNLTRNIERFWTSGESEATRATNVLRRHGLTSLAGLTCVEYGCGVGRVTAALARSFASVHGYDISAAHLEHARERARELSLMNVVLHECSSDLLTPLERCDVFYSCIVFQHNPPPIICELIRNALSALKPGGVALFQVPVYIKGYKFRLGEWLNSDHPLDMQMHCLPQSKIFELVAEQACLPLEIRQDNATGQPERMLSNMWIVRKI